jgi:hypothetical protein
MSARTADPGIRAMKRAIDASRKPLRSDSARIAARLRDPSAVSNPELAVGPIRDARKHVQRLRKRIAQTAPKTAEGRRARRLYLAALETLDEALEQFARACRSTELERARPALERSARLQARSARTGERAGEIVGTKWIAG